MNVPPPLSPCHTDPVQEPFRKDMRQADWPAVYARQERRAHLVPAWMDALGLKAGDHVLELGAGPGFVTMLLAERVGSAGLVYAVDIAAEALVHLERRRRDRGLAQIRPILADAATLDPSGIAPRAALVSMILHHVDEPAAVMRNLARLLPPDAPALVAEFHPDGPAGHGPPPEHRIDPEDIRRWSEQAGFAVQDYRRQTGEHYLTVLRRLP